jgi:hypothetical protein
MSHFLFEQKTRAGQRPIAITLSDVKSISSDRRGTSVMTAWPRLKYYIRTAGDPKFKAAASLADCSPSAHDAPAGRGRPPPIQRPFPRRTAANSSAAGRSASATPAAQTASQCREGRR